MSSSRRRFLFAERSRTSPNGAAARTRSGSLSQDANAIPPSASSSSSATKSHAVRRHSSAPLACQEDLPVLEEPIDEDGFDPVSPWESMASVSSNGVSSEKKPPGNQRENEVIDKSTPSYETVYSWSQSFDNLMKNKVGQKHFAEFLKGEYSDENILFWQACEELKREKNAEKIEEKARIIYEDFISILSPKEVSLDSRVREIVNNNMVRPSASTFDDAQNQIYTLMQRDSYPRFLASPIYKKMIGVHGEIEEV